jgi:hypothetical protein
MIAAAPVSAWQHALEPLLPTHSGDPVMIRTDGDPLLALTHRTARGTAPDREGNLARVPGTPEASGARDEGVASIDEARLARRSTLIVIAHAFDSLLGEKASG